jgi:two-component system sensor histidine kinase HydH
MVVKQHMQWPRWTIVLGLLAAWVALAVWQRHEYDHEQQLAREVLQGQAQSLASALVGGIQSHRRLGRFFEDQLQGALDELVQSQDILAAAIAAPDGRVILSTGDKDLLKSFSIEPGDLWETRGLYHVAPFQLAPDAGPGPHGAGGRGPGGGRGWGRGTWREQAAEETSPFSAGGQFVAVLTLDRTRTDAQIHRAAWLRAWVVAAGGTVLVCLVVVWLAVLRLVRTRHRAQVLEAETRHLRDLGQAAAGLAHETRNPLGLVRGWTQRLAQSGLGSPEARQQAQAVIEECDRLTARINQFLAFARPRNPQPQPTDLDQLLGELAVLLEPDLEAKGLRLDIAPGVRGRVVKADREMLRQVLFNLLQNAIQVSPEKGLVEVGVHPGHDGQVRLEVADRGPGVAPGAVESLFTPYFTTRPNGTGLGLAIVRRIAAAHGWESGYLPRPGGGSIFWLDRIDG